MLKSCSEEQVGVQRKLKNPAEPENSTFHLNVEKSSVFFSLSLFAQTD